MASQPGLGFTAYPFNDYHIDFMEQLAEELGHQGIELYLPHKEFQPSIIFCKLVPHIWESQFVLSEVSEINQNVLFEHGYAMGLQRPAIFVRSKGATSDLPGFLGDIERIEYNYRSDITTKLATFLEHASLKNQGGTFTKGLNVPAWLTEEVPVEPGLIYFLEGSVRQDVIRGLRKLMDQRPFRLESDSAAAKGHYLVHYLKMIKRSQFVVGHLVSTRVRNCEDVNAGVAFLLGAAAGMGKPMLILQQEPAPNRMIDLQGLARSYESESQAKTIATDWLENIKERIAAAQNTPVVPSQVKSDGLKVSFGDRAAERDPYLLETFLPTAHYDRAIDGSCSLFLGPRGTGKTADFLYIKHELSASTNNFVVVIRPYDSEFLKLRGFLARSFATKHYQFVHGSVWRTLIYTEVINAIVERTGEGGIGSGKEEQRALTFHSANREIFDGSFTDRLQTIVQSLDAIEETGAVDPTIEKIKEVVRTARLNEIEVILGEIGRLRPIRVLIDGLDANWDATDATSIHLLAGLIHAADEINSKMDACLKITLFMRSDIFDVISRVDPDLDKRARDTLSWNSELLVRLLGLRIQRSLQTDTPPDACWRQIFPERVKEVSVEDYMISRTLMRPRDLINLATACVIEAQDRFHSVVTEGDLLAAEEKYSESRLADLEQEHFATYPEIGRLFDAFLGLPTRQTEGKVLALLTDQKTKLKATGQCPDWIADATPQHLYRVLYEVNFFGLMQPRGTDSYSYWKSFDRARAAATQLPPVRAGRRRKKVTRREPMPTVVVHPAFPAYLELVPATA